MEEENLATAMEGALDQLSSTGQTPSHATEAAKSALEAGASPQAAIEAAKAAGATPKEVQVIQKALKKAEAQVNMQSSQKISQEAKAALAMVENAPTDSLLDELANQLEEMDSNAADAAMAALDSGASMQEAVMAAKESGASADELAEIVSTLSKACSQSSNADASIAAAAALASSSGSLSKAELTQLAKENADESPEDAVVAALAYGASPEQALQVAQAAGASKQELASMAKAMSGGLQGQSSSNVNANIAAAAALVSSSEGLSKAELTQLTRENVNSNPEEAVVAALSHGASPEQALQVAQAAGASKKELASMAKAIAGGSQQAAASNEAVQAALAQGATAEDIIALKKAIDSGGLAQSSNVAEMASVALRAGASVEQVLQMASGTTNTSSGQNVRAEDAVIKAISKSKDKSAVEKAVLVAAAGGSVHQALKVAKESGASAGELSAIAASLSTSSIGIDEESVKSVLAACQGKSATEKAMEVAAAGADTEQILRVAAENGASQEELSTLKATFQKKTSQNAMMRTEESQGLPQVALKKVAQSTKGKTGTEIINIALKAGASPEQALQVAKSNGATPQELATLAQALNAQTSTSHSSLPNGHMPAPGVDTAKMASLVQNLDGKNVSDIIAQASSAGASKEQILQLVSSVNGTQDDKMTVLASLMATPGSSSEGIGNKEFSNLAKAAANKGMDAITTEAIMAGASSDQVLQLAVASGATSEEVAQLANNLSKVGNVNSSMTMQDQIQQIVADTGKSHGEAKAIVNVLSKNNVMKATTAKISDKALSSIVESSQGKTPEEVAAFALAAGASKDQALQVAKESGASPAELTMIAKQIPSQIDQLSRKELANVTKMTSTQSPSEAAKTAIAAGASQEQVMQLARDKGASIEELQTIQAMAAQIQSIGSSQTQQSKILQAALDIKAAGGARSRYH